MAGIRRRMANFQSPQAAAVCAAFKARADDVFIATYPKCGTTWMQQIVHSLRTGGDMDFGEITQVVPWLELAHDLGQDPNAPQRATPRAFKTHLNGERVPTGARHIYIIRDPRDVVVSFFRFYEGWVFEPGSIDLETFSHEFFLKGSQSGTYWHHLASWWPRISSPRTLMFSYEEMNADPSRAVTAVAQFLDIDDVQTIRRAEQLSSFETMRAHAHLFDDNLVRRFRNAACGLPGDATTSKVRTGTVGASRNMLSASTLRQFDTMWRRHLTVPLGIESYDDACRLIREHRTRVHGGAQV